MYDPQLGRFHTQDRFAEKYINLTPYQYAANNPIKFIDVNGDSTTYVDTKGNTLIENQDNRTDVIVISDQNLEEFEADVNEYSEEGVLDKPETSDELNQYGYNITEMKDNANTLYPGGDNNYNLGFEAGYTTTYEGKSVSIIERVIDVGAGAEKGEGSYLVIGKQIGRREGKQDANEGKMNMFDPKIKHNAPRILLRSKNSVSTSPGKKYWRPKP